MNLKSSVTSLSIVFVVFTFLRVTSSASIQCTDDELDEAQKAFRNCVDSAKAGIVSRHAPSTDADADDKEEQQEVPPLCDELDTMLMGCEAEVAELSRCKGRRHVANLKAIHLSSIADVLKALNDDVKVDECDVFKHQPQEPEVDEEDEPEVHQFPESGPESISVASLSSLTSSALVVVLAAVLRLF